MNGNPRQKNLLIARLNVEQAAAVDPGVSSDAHALVETAEQALLGLREEVSFLEFIGTYLKELIRTYSGVWGVLEVHDHAVFGHVDAFVAGLKERCSGDADWARVLRPEPGAVYAATALGSSVQRLEQWFASL